MNEWRQNSRLRLGGWLIIAILLSYLSLILSDWEQSLKDDHRELADHKRRLELLTRQKEWIGRADAVRAIIIQMEGRFWKASSRGLAQAKVQNWLDILLRREQINDARTQVEPALDMTGYDAIWQVTAKIEGLFEPRKLADMLHAIETSVQIVTVEQLDAVHNKRPRFTLVIKAYFQAR